MGEVHLINPTCFSLNLTEQRIEERTREMHTVVKESVFFETGESFMFIFTDMGYSEALLYLHPNKHDVKDTELLLCVIITHREGLLIQV